MKTIPRATYRIQFHAGFTLDDAAGLADYLKALGVSHLFASPYLRAAPGSTHGYDVVDPGRINAELGGMEVHNRLCRALDRCGLGQILDVVPNHYGRYRSRKPLVVPVMRQSKIVAILGVGNKPVD